MKKKVKGETEDSPSSTAPRFSNPPGIVTSLPSKYMMKSGKSVSQGYCQLLLSPWTSTAPETWAQYAAAMEGSTPVYVEPESMIRFR